MSTVPSEDQIASAARQVVSAHHGSSSTGAGHKEELGTAKILTILQLENDWQLSEKRLKAVLTRHRLLTSSALDPASAPTTSSSSPLPSPSTATSTAAADPPAANGTGDPPVPPSSSKKKKKKKPARTAPPSHVPRSYIDASLVFPPGIEAHYFDPVKGKGLVATRDFDEGDVVFQEEAFVPTPPPDALASMLGGEICTHCFLPIQTAVAGGKRCARGRCTARFCGALCQSRGMATHHALLCTGSNPSVQPLMDLIEKQGWQSLHSVARSLARLLLTHSSTPPPSIGSTSTTNPKPASFDEVYSQLGSFATVSELERRARNPGWSTEQGSFTSALRSAHAALRAGLDPFDDARTQQRQTPGQKPAPFPLKVDELAASATLSGRVRELFSYATFLTLLGRSNINMESHGGLYLLHSFLNHDCAPNVRIRHVPVRGRYASMKIAAVCARRVARGEELTISYVDPATEVRRRRMVLWRDYCFGPCGCGRCVEEVRGLSEEERRETERLQEVTQREDEALRQRATQGGGAQPVEQRDLSGLEDELRDTLGF